MQTEIESRNLRLYVSNRVLRIRDRENCRLTEELAQQRDEHMETLIELQDVKADLGSYKAYVVELKGKVLQEKETQHFFREKLWEGPKDEV